TPPPQPPRPTSTSPAPYTTLFRSFKWWLNTDGGPTWMLLQDWSASNTLTWTPTVANAAYKLSTWVRSSGNSADTYEGYQFTNFAITPPPRATLRCVTADQTAPPTRGTTLSATSPAGAATAQSRSGVKSR